jgi:hypothetical protein
MPNWCINKVIITAPDIQDVLGRLSKGNVPFSFERIVSPPPTLAMRPDAPTKFAVAAQQLERDEFDAAKATLDIPSAIPEVILARINAEELKFSDFYSCEPGDDFPINLDALMIIAKAVESSDSVSPSDWYAWRMAQWGVKWELDEDTTVIIKDEHTAILYFDTPWNPPDEIYYVLSEKFDKCNIKATYHEPGMGEQGQFVFIQGETVSVEQYEFSRRRMQRDLGSEGVPWGIRWTKRKYGRKERHESKNN